MMYVPEEMGKFTFVRLASLRAAQLIRGCVPRVDVGYKPTTTALREVSEGKVCEGTDDTPAEAIEVGALAIPVPRNGIY